jgi:hypothetical protein
MSAADADILNAETPNPASATADKTVGFINVPLLSFRWASPALAVHHADARAANGDGHERDGMQQICELPMKPASR